MEGRAYEDELAANTRAAMRSDIRKDEERRLRRNARDEATDQEVTARGTARRQAAEENLRRERLDAASRVNHPATDPSLPLAERVRLESQAAAAAARESRADAESAGIAEAAPPGAVAPARARRR